VRLYCTSVLYLVADEHGEVGDEVRRAPKRDVLAPVAGDEKRLEEDAEDLLQARGRAQVGLLGALAGGGRGGVVVRLGEFRQEEELGQVGEELDTGQVQV